MPKNAAVACRSRHFGLSAVAADELGQQPRGIASVFRCPQYSPCAVVGGGRGVGLPSRSSLNRGHTKAPFGLPSRANANAWYPRRARQSRHCKYRP
eukprot:4446365-Pyramimonas_sp.AAC.1